MDAGAHQTSPGEVVPGRLGEPIQLPAGYNHHAGCDPHPWSVPNLFACRGLGLLANLDGVVFRDLQMKNVWYFGNMSLRRFLCYRWHDYMSNDLVQGGWAGTSHLH